MNSKKMNGAFVVTIIAALLMLATLLMPFASATKEEREQLLKYPDYETIEGTGLTNSDLTDISLYEYGKAYSYMAKENIQKEMSIACLVVIIAFAVFSVLTLLFSFLKKPVAIIIFDILVMIDFRIIRFDFSDRGVVPSETYNWGAANYLVYALGVVIVVGAVIIFVEKRKAIKLLKTTTETVVPN